MEKAWLKGKIVAVAVLGDLAQSPRMIAHARAIAEAGAEVRLIGYAGDAELPPLPNSIHLFGISGAGTARWGAIPRIAYLPLAALRLIAMSFRLRLVLRRAFRGAHVVLLQVPPAIPALPLALAEARRVDAGLVVDWHNLSHAMLALRMGAGHPLVRMLRWAEGSLGRHVDGHMAVTPTLARRLKELWALQPVAVLPDRPKRMEQPLAGAERSAALSHIMSALGGNAALKPHRVLVSPTSWSLDEDMDMILDAAASLDTPSEPLLLIATGRGPRREAFLARAAALGAKLHILTGWLSEEDFRLSLRVADLGLSLHRSASEADFPMKISDMIGAGLPVLALDYGAGLRDGLPSMPAAATFRNAKELAQHIQRLQQDRALAEAKSAALRNRNTETWDAVWQREAAPLLARVIAAARS